MASDLCVRRLTKEIAALKKEPLCDPCMKVVPNESNILEMHYVIEGSPKTPYEYGIYHGKLIFPKDYPLKPPSVIMITPSGRFQPNRRLCLSMSDFHPESWNPMWSISTILRGLHAFMVGTDPTLGSIETTDSMKRKLAKSSLEYNVQHTPIFTRLFPEYVEQYQIEVQRKREMMELHTANKKNVSSSMKSIISSDNHHNNNDIDGDDDNVNTIAVVGRRGGRIIAMIQDHMMPLMATMAGLVAILSIFMAWRFI